MYLRAAATNCVCWRTSFTCLVLLVCMGVVTGNTAPSGLVDSFNVLPNLLRPQLMERLESEASGVFTYSCGHWCDSEVGLLRKRIAEQLHLDLTQLGDVRLEETAQLDPSLHASWAGVAVAYLTTPDESHGMMLVNADGSRTDVVGSHEWQSLLGSVVVMPSVSKAIFRSRVKLLIIPVLLKARPFWEYYISKGLWEALVSTHCTGSFLGLDFFRSHTRYPHFWHACVWGCFGSAALTFLAMPLFWRPMLCLVEAIESRIETNQLQKPHSVPLPRGPTLLEKLSSDACMPFDLAV